jgi:hypothetical protein
MADVTMCEELAKNRAYLLRMGGVEISAMKLEGYKATQLGGTISPINVSAGGSKVEGDDWLIIVKDKNNIVMPYEVWVKQVAGEINKASGSNVNTISVLTGGEPILTSGKPIVFEAKVVEEKK